MNPSTLKRLYIENNPSGHFFDKDAMHYFGDTMKNYGVRSASLQVRMIGNGYEYKKPVDCWELYRKFPVKNGLKDSVFFRKDNLKILLSKPCEKL